MQILGGRIKKKEVEVGIKILGWNVWKEI